MDDVPWALVIYTLLILGVFVAGVASGIEALVYAGAGGVMGFGAGVVESLEWARRLNRKYGIGSVHPKEPNNAK